MGGVGKTTLAQLLYNDKEIKDYFRLTAWVCVSEEFDVIRVTKTLIESIISEPCNLQEMSLLQDKLREKAVGKKFLFVLDDLWNDNYSDWDLVQAAFTYRARGNMRKLINLRHLDISGTCVKEIPVQIGRLKSLRTLTAFVLGKSTRSGGIGELGQLSNLQGKLSILNLENVVNPMDALGANLKDKKHLSEVELAWGREDAYDSIKERHVLESPQPSINLAKLIIRFYGGTRFPDWLRDSSFSNIQVMCLSDCSTCFSLPPVGRLPALKELYIEGMKSVISIGIEFYQGDGASLSQPFQSLKKLEFKVMPEWEEWLSCPGRGQSHFPCLEELTLENYPKLRGNLPNHLPCLRKLSVSDCRVLHERVTRIRWIPWSLIVNIESLRQSLEELKIVRCPGLSSLLETESLSVGA
ncbi:hypothetical protein ACFXTN_036482 [Malus domestica]